MSQEPHAEDVSPGSTPTPEDRPNVELERQRAEGGDLPGRPTRDPFDEEGRDEEEDDPSAGESPRTPPSESVPDDVAVDAARSVDPAEGTPDDTPPDAGPDDPMQPAGGTSDARGVPRHEQ